METRPGKRIEVPPEEKIGIPLEEKKASLSIINSINDRKEKKPQLFNEKKGMLCPNRRKGHDSSTKKGGA